MSRFEVTVYPEDLDGTGAASAHALLRFFARARSEWFLETGRDQATWMDAGLRFPAYHLEAKFPGRATLGTRIVIQTSCRKASIYRLAFQQTGRTGSALIAEATVEVVCSTSDGRLVPLPEGVPPPQDSGGTTSISS